MLPCSNHEPDENNATAISTVTRPRCILGTPDHRILNGATLPRSSVRRLWRFPALPRSVYLCRRESGGGIWRARSARTAGVADAYPGPQFGLWPKEMAQPVGPSHFERAARATCPHLNRLAGSGSTSRRGHPRTPRASWICSFVLTSNARWSSHLQF